MAGIPAGAAPNFSEYSFTDEEPVPLPDRLGQTSPSTRTGMTKIPATVHVMRRAANRPRLHSRRTPRFDTQIESRAGKPSCRQHAKARTCPFATVLQYLAIRVTSVNSYARAVAMRMRSAGSRGGTPGREVDATSTDGGMSARLTPGSAQIGRTRFRTGVERQLPLADRVPISHAVMGETTSRDRTPCASLNSRAAGSLKDPPRAIQMTAQVSSR